MEQLLTLNPQTLLFALLGGILPTIAWLFFWLQEDVKDPEPRSLIFFSFLSGMLAVFIVFPLQLLAKNHLGDSPEEYVLLAWAAIEEVVKFAMISFVALQSVYFDEPVDAMVYLVTVALGFSALENTLFLLTPLLAGDTSAALITGNLRYMGATVLHTAASALLGACISLAYCHGWFMRTIAIIGGLILATGLHTGFNILIMKGDDLSTALAFGATWIAIILVLMAFERSKHITCDIHPA